MDRERRAAAAVEARAAQDAERIRGLIGEQTAATRAENDALKRDNARLIAQARDHKQQLEASAANERDALARLDRATRELKSLRSQASQHLNAQWNAGQQQQQRQQQQQQALNAQRAAQARAAPAPPQRAPAPPPAGRAPAARVSRGSNPRSWNCPHCTFANLLHRTSRTAAGLCICELCNMTSELVDA